MDKTNDGLALTISELGETKQAVKQTNATLSVFDQMIQKISILRR